MNNQLKKPRDESDLSVLKEFPVAFKSGCHETAVSVNDFPERFWNRCDETLHPLYSGLTIGLVVGLILGWLVAISFMKK